MPEGAAPATPPPRKKPPFSPWWRRRSPDAATTTGSANPNATPSPPPRLKLNISRKPPPTHLYACDTAPVKASFDVVTWPTRTSPAPPVSPSPSLPELTRRVAPPRTPTLYIKNLPEAPAPLLAPPRSPQLLVRRATPYRPRDPEAIRARALSTDSTSSYSRVLRARRVDAGQLSPKPPVEHYRRRRSSLPNLRDPPAAAVATPASTACETPLLAPPPSTTLSDDTASSPGFPHTPSPALSAHPYIAGVDDGELPISGLGIIAPAAAHSPEPDPAGRRASCSTAGEIIEQYATYAAADSRAVSPDLQTATERTRALLALEGRSPRLADRRTTDDEETLLRLQQSPIVASDYQFQRAVAATAAAFDDALAAPSLAPSFAPSSTFSMPVFMSDAATQTVPTTTVDAGTAPPPKVATRDKAIQVVDERAIDCAIANNLVEHLQEDNRRLMLRVACLERQLDSLFD